MAAKEGKCHICGEIKVLTRDHIPQLSLYPKSVRSNVPNFNIVLACANCNNSASIVDEVLKVFVGLVAHAPWRSEMRDSVDSTISNHRRLARLLEENTRFEELPTKSGASVPAKIIKIPKEMRDKLYLALDRIIKATYFQTFGEVLVENHELSIFHPDGIHPSLHQELEDTLMNGDWRSLNQGTFHYCFASMKSGDTVCVINFYGNIEFCYCIKRNGWRGIKLA